LEDGMNLEDESSMAHGQPQAGASDRAWLPTLMAWSQLDEHSQSRFAQREGMTPREITQILSSRVGLASMPAQARTRLLAQLDDEYLSARCGAMLEPFTNAHYDALDEAIEDSPRLFSGKVVLDLMRTASRRLNGERRAVRGALFHEHRARFGGEIERKEGWFKLLREVCRP
jgi:hypothetical protein